MAYAFPLGYSWYSADRKLGASIGAGGRLVVFVNSLPHYLEPFPAEKK